MDSATQGEFPSDGEDNVFSEMISPVVEVKAAEAVAVEEKEAVQIVSDKSFRVERRQFGLQYNQLYNLRLRKQSAIVMDMLQEKGSTLSVVNIADLVKTVAPGKAEDNKDTPLFSVLAEKMNKSENVQVLKRAHQGQVVIIGTLIKDHGILDVLKEVTYGGMAESGMEVKRELLLEDESSKVRLSYGEKIQDIFRTSVNGNVYGLIGNLKKDGTFFVEGIVYPEPIITLHESPTFHYKMVFVAGLGVGGLDEGKASLLFNHLGLYAKNTKEPNKLLVFFVGNSLESSGLTCTERAAALVKLDDWLFKLSQVAEVFLIPGLCDPCSVMLHQQPMSRLLLPKSHSSPGFHSETNPARVYVPSTNQKKPLEILMCSGENVQDYMKTTKITSSLLAASNMLRNGHLCPTAPNTTRILPCLKEDVFALEKAPNFLVFGNDSVDCKIIVDKRTHVLSLPSFQKSHQIVIFNNDCTPTFAHF